jgi:hypothetical protein
MNKKTLENYIEEGSSINDICKKTGKGNTSVRYWLKKYGLKTKPNFNLENRFKYSNEKLLEIWKQSDSVNQFLLNLGVGTGGGAWYHYKKRLILLGIDLSESTLNGRSRGGQMTAKLRNSKTIKKRIRLKRSSLKKSMDLYNIPYKCSKCNLFEWFNKKLKLHIHHKNHDKTDNKIENLEYLCPNCHGIYHYNEN